MRAVSRNVIQKIMNLNDVELYEAAQQLQLMCMGGAREGYLNCSRLQYITHFQRTLSSGKYV